MRSDLIFGALAHLENRYQLCQLASKATRKLHKPNTRVQDTTNDVLTRFNENNPASEKLTAEYAGHVPDVQRRAA
ncbi:MAG TPA: DNA-directed RNA polymerase subunit omega [Acidobacteriaceae bacterium]